MDKITHILSGNNRLKIKKILIMDLLITNVSVTYATLIP